MSGAQKRLERSPSPAASIALAGINEADRGPDAADEAMAGAKARAKLMLERNLAFLGTVGNNAPFVGLLGTVIGIIQAFDALKVEQTQAANAAHQQAAAAAAAVANAGQLGATGRVMGTIAEALVATAIGLFVAIPAVAAFNYFQRKVRAIIGSADTLTHVVLAHLRATSFAGVGAGAEAPSARTSAGEGEKKGERSSGAGRGKKDEE
jgi:biopolymer transport protein ExbB